MNGGDFVWWPSPEVKDRANLTAFIQKCGVADYDSLVSWSEENPEEFHKNLFDFIDLRFFKYPAIFVAPKPDEYISRTRARPEFCVNGQSPAGHEPHSS